MKLRYRWVFIPAILAIFFLIALTDAIKALVPTHGRDADTVLGLIESVEYGEDLTGYQMTAWLFALLPASMIYTFVYSVGVVAILVFLWPLRTRLHLALASFILIAPIMLILTQPLKDTFLVLLAIFVMSVISTKRPRFVKIIAVVLLYSIYGFAMRQYYLLIAMTFLALLLFIESDLRVRCLMILGMVFFFIALPDSVYFDLQGSRDTFNHIRVGSGVGARTIFFNPVPPDNFLSFLVNYMYAAFRLSFSILFDFGIRGLFLTLNVFLYWFLIGYGYRIGQPEGRIAAHLLVAHNLVLWLFEPDLGSYARHLVSVFLYLRPIILEIHLDRFRFGKAQSG